MADRLSTLQLQVNCFDDVLVLVKNRVIYANGRVEVLHGFGFIRIFQCCQAQFQLTSQVTSRTDLALNLEIPYHPPTRESRDPASNRLYMVGRKLGDGLADFFEVMRCLANH